MDLFTYNILTPFFGRLTSILVLVVALLSGCGGGHDVDQGSGGQVELTYWPAPNPQEMQLADSLVNIWNRLHPDVHVRMQPIPVSQSTEEVLLAAIAGKTTPDVCSNIWPGALLEYTKAGGLVALDRFSDFDSIAGSRTPPDLLSTFRSADGHFYQMPWKTNPVMMYYNMAIFEKAGITAVPRTYSEYFAAGEKVKRIGETDGEIRVWMGERDIRPIWWQRLFDFYPFYIAASNGKTLFANGTIAFEDSSAVGVLSFFRKCYGEQFFPRTFFQGGDPFLLEKKATHFAGPWVVPTLAQYAPHIRYGVAPLPVPDGHEGPTYTYGDFKNIAIFSNTRHPAESWQFVKFLISAEHDLLLLNLADQIPVRGDLLTNPLFGGYFRVKPVMKRFAEQAPYTRGMDAAPDLKEIFDAISQAYERCAVYGRVTPAEAVHDAARHTRLIVEWNQ